MSRLLNRDAITSGLVGALIIGILEGAFVSLIGDWAFLTGIACGAFYGASLGSYFSVEDKYTNLLWALISTILLIGVLVFLECDEGVTMCIGTIKYGIGFSFVAAGFTIFMGLVTAPGMTILLNRVESYIEKVFDLD